MAPWLVASLHRCPVFCPEGKVQKPLLPVGGTADWHSIVPVVYVSLLPCYGLLSWTLGAKKDFRVL